MCDWYLELAKPRLYEPSNEAVSAVLLHALERTLLLLHPVMPFVTEEIWSLLPGERGLLAVAHWPEPDSVAASTTRPRRCSIASCEAVRALRSYRDEVGAKPSARSPRACSPRTGTTDLPRPARAARPLRARGRRVRKATSLAEVDDSRWRGEVLLPTRSIPRRPSAGGRPRARRLQGEIDRPEGKLANEGFVSKAPADVVEGERRKLDEYREALVGLGSDDLPRRPRSTCSRSSCSACGSASTACTG